MASVNIINFMRHTQIPVFASVFALTALVLPALAERTPRPMGPDPRVRTVTYNPADVMRIDTKLRVNTAIELGRSERIDQVLLGDSEAFQVEVLSNRNVISIKPVLAGATSNMTVYTGRRTLTFTLREGRVKTPTYRVVLAYPDRRPQTSRRAAVTKAALPAAQIMRDTGYAFSGKARFRPVRVWNDGRDTYFEFRGTTRPAIFGVNGEGFETMVNSTTKGRVVKVPGVRSDFVIRIGDEAVCIKRIEARPTTRPSTVAALAQREF